jgi:hypothetical protein
VSAPTEAPRGLGFAGAARGRAKGDGAVDFDLGRIDDGLGELL